MAIQRSRKKHRSLSPAEVRWTLPEPEKVPATTAGLTSQGSIIGQERALKALRMGLELYRPGYNVFVCGLAGTGRTSTVQRMLEGMKPACALAEDLAYVHNFDENERPRLISLPRGTAHQFRDMVHENVEILRREIDRLINSPETKARVQSFEADFKSRAQESAQRLDQQVKESGLALVGSQDEGSILPMLVYMHEDKAYDVAQLSALVAEEVMTEADCKRLQAAAEELEPRLGAFIAEQQTLGREFARVVGDLEKSLVRMALEAFRASTTANFSSKAIETWLDQIEETILDNLEIFRRSLNKNEGAEEQPADFSAFDINVVLHNKGPGCPIVVENNPSFQNVFGSQDRVAVAPGVYGTDFTRIKPGSLLRAQGGYLILNAPDVLTENGVWTQLKRTLRSSELVIQPPEGSSQGVPVLNPEAIPLNVKVILLGNGALYETLYERDHEFAKIFKIKADFDTSIRFDDEVLERYLDALVRILREENLRDMERGAVEAILQMSMRMAGERERVTTRFSLLADIIREADYLAGKADAKLIEREHVLQAIRDQRERHNLIEEKLFDRIREGEMKVDTQGRLVGQINGLTVLSVGIYSFGSVARITCRTSVGKGGVLDIERETELTGSSYEKGSLILQGFLAGRFGQDYPLTFGASICFEQSYGFIDGDSASSTELYLLLSSLASVPLRQDIAVTGSVDQFGATQAIGGVNEKVEAFYDLCESRGLTGTQGVIIPVTNVRDLMLSTRVVKAMARGDFHLYPVATIDEGMEILTGLRSGDQNASGAWTPDSINEAVQKALERLYRLGKD